MNRRLANVVASSPPTKPPRPASGKVPPPRPPNRPPGYRPRRGQRGRRDESHSPAEPRAARKHRQETAMRNTTSHHTRRRATRSSHQLVPESKPRAGQSRPLARPPCPPIVGKDCQRIRGPCVGTNVVPHVRGRPLGRGPTTLDLNVHLRHGTTVHQCSGGARSDTMQREGATLVPQARCMPLDDRVQCPRACA